MVLRIKQLQAEIFLLENVHCDFIKMSPEIPPLIPPPHSNAKFPTWGQVSFAALLENGGLGIEC